MDTCSIRGDVTSLLCVTSAVPFTGAHINPAVTVASAAVGKFSWRKVPHYLLGQYLGAFVASFVVWAVYFGKSKPTIPHRGSLRVLFFI